ncbi:hypothetical protein GWI33_000039 [Rhynchophorus ferrugineus]|uniref:Uncharacterized protein n=1 Tax=Rhynchophorus ferrugineus TaxID=354439 RepID=A0A834IVF4_RHYFE|nr:hypothetical protein GWI33_000039 [Rhynchophorus ferrugineus]
MNEKAVGGARCRFRAITRAISAPSSRRRLAGEDGASPKPFLRHELTPSLGVVYLGDASIYRKAHPGPARSGSLFGAFPVLVRLAWLPSPSSSSPSSPTPPTPAPTSMTPRQN